MIGITIDDSELRAMAQKLANVNRDMHRKVEKAIRDGLKEAKPFAEGLISQTYNVGTPSLGMSVSGLQGYLQGSGGMKPVSEFGPVSTGERIGQVVSVEIIRGSRKSILPGSRGLGRGAFMIGDGRVMERRQDEKYPIFPVSTIGIPQMLGSRKVSNPVRDKMSETITTRIGRLWLDSF